jgi:hypothetical protein
MPAPIGACKMLPDWARACKQPIIHWLTPTFDTVLRLSPALSDYHSAICPLLPTSPPCRLSRPSTSLTTPTPWRLRWQSISCRPRPLLSSVTMHSRSASPAARSSPTCARLSCLSRASNGANGMFSEHIGSSSSVIAVQSGLNGYGHVCAVMSLL